MVFKIEKQFGVLKTFSIFEIKLYLRMDLNELSSLLVTDFDGQGGEFSFYFINYFTNQKIKCLLNIYCVL